MVIRRSGSAYPLESLTGVMWKEEVVRALIAAARSVEGTLENPEPTGFFDRFGDSSLNFELVA